MEKNGRDAPRDLRGRRFLVVGLARTGQAVAEFLAGRGAQVTATDRRPLAELGPEVGALDRQGVRLEVGGHRIESFLEAEEIVLSPGVPLGIEPLARARAQGVAVVSEIEFAYEFLRAPILAITGTNGKSTVTTLVGECLRACGHEAFVGGNLGTPLIAAIPQEGKKDYVVAEVSSYQLEGIRRFRPKVACLLNVTEDHLDRYASFAEYAAAKERVFLNQGTGDFAILSYDDPVVRAMAPRVRARVVFLSVRERLEEGLYQERDRFFVALPPAPRRVFDASRLKIVGIHNRENALAALGVAAVLGLDLDRAMEAIREFPGLEHRVEHVAEIDGATYVNDSKGTNVGAVVRSLESFERPIVLIAGGRDKLGSYEPLRRLVASKVRAMVLIGEARERIRASLGDATETVLAESLKEAVEVSRRLARPGDVVLFSPACSSFDMFRDFEERGRLFKKYVKGLKGVG